MRHANADIEVYRPAEADHTGTVTEEKQTLILSRADVQEQGRSLRRLRQEHEAGDALLFLPDGEIEGAEPQPGEHDRVEIDYDNGRTAEGTLQATYYLDDKLLVTLQ